MSEDTKHFSDCWRVHPVCAQLRIRELERENTALRTDRDKMMRLLNGEPVAFPFEGACGLVADLGETATGPVPCFPETFVTHDLSEETRTFPVGKAQDGGGVVSFDHVQRIPGSASWTAPAVDDPPTVLDAEHPHS